MLPGKWFAVQVGLAKILGQADNAEQTARLLEKAGPDAPVLAISASIFGLSKVMPVVFQQRRPAAVFHLPVIGGHDWCLVPRWLEEGHRVTLHYLRDKDGREVDFIVAVNRKPWFAVEAKVAEIFWPTRPLLPTPVTTTRPLHAMMQRQAA